ncbi:MAG: hypothetical protein ACTSVI_06680 [Promethearchaeota archaeon]
MKKKKKREIMVCPKCKKPTLKQATSVSGWLDAALYICSDPNCGYSGRFYITLDPDEMNKKEDENDQLND